MLTKKQSLIFCLFKTGGAGRGVKIKIVFKKPKNEPFFYDTSGRKKITGGKFASLFGKSVYKIKTWRCIEHPFRSNLTS